MRWSEAGQSPAESATERAAFAARRALEGRQDMAVLNERRARMGLASLGLPSDVDVGASVRSIGAVETWTRLVADESGSLAARRARAVDLDEVEGETEFARARFVIPGDAE